MKQTIRLNEADFNRLVKETMKRVLNESSIFHTRDFVKWTVENHPEIIKLFNSGELDEGRMFDYAYQYCKDNGIELTDEISERSRLGLTRYLVQNSSFMKSFKSHNKRHPYKLRKSVLKEDIFKDAENDFDILKDYYYGEEGKDFLIAKLWYFIDDKPGFINYMKTSAQFPDFEDDL